jgi:hypothetical protein
MARELSTGSGRGTIRASDAERDQAVETLRSHYAAGRLTAPELEERLELAYGAGSRDELAALLSDLPSNRRRRAARRFYGWQRRALNYHAGAYVSINGTLVTVWVVAGEGQFWPAWVLGPTTAMLGWHAVGSRMLHRSIASRERRP